MTRNVLDYAMRKVAEHGRDLVEHGGITVEQLTDALAHRRRELMALTDGEIALRLLDDLPHGEFCQA